MAILDEFGRTINHRAARAANHNSHRPWEPIEKKDIAQLIPASDRVTLQSHARRIYINFGPIKNAVNQRSMYSVGRAFVPTFKGGDKEFGTAATDWLINSFYSIGDTRGGMHDFKTNLFGWSSAIDVDGEIFILLTETKTGFAQYQGIPSHRIATPQGLQDGPMRGGELRDGIVYHPWGAAKEYAFCDQEGKLSEWLPASNVIHLYDPEWQYQGRGITAFAHCINDCRDIIQSTEWERLAMMQMSSISLIEYNDNGGPDPDDPYNALVGNTGGTQGMTVQSMDGGTVRYFKSNSGGKVETLVNNRPGNPFMEFHDRLLKSAYAGLNWPYAFYSGHGAGGGTAQRTEIAMAQRSIEDRQDLLFYAAKRLVSYAVAKAQKRGDLPQSADWFKWDFSTPPKLTIDDGRITKELETLWKMGAANMRDIVSMRGKTYEDHIRERAQEIALRKMAAAEATQLYGVPVDDREMAMLTANEQPTTTETNDDESDPNRKPTRETETE
jgi:capsid protein